MTEKTSESSLDDFYTPEFILQKERIYGINYSSSGGEAATKELLLRAGLKPGEEVLDVGCAQGGPAMYMATTYGVNVHGIDYSQNLITLGKQRLATSEPIIQQRVKLEYADATRVELKSDYYDVIYSKESICMIEDKKNLHQNLKRCLRPGGRVFISDWCNGDRNPSRPTEEAGYKINHSNGFTTIADNVHHMEAAGFIGVKTQDLTKQMINFLQDSLNKFTANKQAFIKDFDEDSYKEIEDKFRSRIENLKEGRSRWVLFTANS